MSAGATSVPLANLDCFNIRRLTGLPTGGFTQINVKLHGDFGMIFPVYTNGFRIDIQQDSTVHLSFFTQVGSASQHVCHAVMSLGDFRQLCEIGEKTMAEHAEKVAEKTSKLS